MATVVVTRKKRRSLSLMTLVTSGHGSPNPVTPPTHVSISENRPSEHSIPQVKQQSLRSQNLSLAHHRRSTSWPAVPLTESNERPCHAGKPIITKQDMLPVSNDNAAHLGTLREKDYQVVDEKVSAMLAATASLKPAPTTPSSIFGSSMFIKVSSALDRIYSKHPHSSGRISRTRFQKHVQDSPSSILQQQFPNEEQQSDNSPLTTIEIRLNEGNNLNRKKVQRIVGGSVSRKPVPGHGQGLRTRLDDSTEQLQSGIDSSQNLDTPPTSDDDLSAFCSQNPFTSEHDLEDDLTDGFLNTPPAAASTPKSKISRDSIIVEDIQQTSVKGKQLFIYKDIDRDKDAVDSKYTERSTIADDVFSEKYSEAISKSLRHSPTLQDAKRVKKHPSPSKHALEDLEAALTSYTRLRGHGNFDKVDELAADFNNNPALLIPQDPNRLIERSWEKRVRQQHERHRSPLRTRPLSPVKGWDAERFKLTQKTAFPHLEGSKYGYGVDELQL